MLIQVPITCRQLQNSLLRKEVIEEGGNRKGTDEGSNVVLSPASAAASPSNVGNADPGARNANINCSHICMRRIYHSTKYIQLAPIRMALPFLSISQPRLHQIQISLRPSCRGGPEDSETPPTCKVWIILSQVTAI